MRILVQRSKDAKVIVNDKIIGSIDYGVVIFVGFTHSDTESEIDYLIDKLINLRIFEDENNVMNLSLKDVNGKILSISQFTLYADTTKGRRPSYVNSLPSNDARKLYDLFNKKLESTGVVVETGEFGADMKVHLINDGPVTIMLERECKNE